MCVPIRSARADSSLAHLPGIPTPGVCHDHQRCHRRGPGVAGRSVAAAVGVTCRQCPAWGTALAGPASLMHPLNRVLPCALHLHSSIPRKIVGLCSFRGMTSRTCGSLGGTPDAAVCMDLSQFLLCTAGHTESSIPSSWHVLCEVAGAVHHEEWVQRVLLVVLHCLPPCQCSLEGVRGLKRRRVGAAYASVLKAWQHSEMGDGAHSESDCCGSPRLGVHPPTRTPTPGSPPQPTTPPSLDTNHQTPPTPHTFQSSSAAPEPSHRPALMMQPPASVTMACAAAVSHSHVGAMRG